MGFFDPLLRRIVVGNPPLVGDVLPRRRVPQVPPFDGRTAALRALRRYVCALEYYRQGDRPGAPAIPFRVDPRNFHVDYPDSESAVDLAAGTVVVVPTGRFTYDQLSIYDERSRDAFGPGTCLHVLSSYSENFNLEFRCALKQQRRAWKGGTEIAFAPVEEVTVLRLRTEGYYDQPAIFSLQDGALLDVPDEARGRRAVQLGVQLMIQVVRLVNTQTLKPVPMANVDVDESSGQVVSTATNLPPGS